MEIIQIVGVGIVAAILAVTVKQQNAEIGLLIGICGSILIFFMIMPKLGAVVQVFNTLSTKLNTDATYIGIILKIVGIAYIAEFGAQICSDAGENAIASKIDLGGKVLVMLLSAPILLGLMSLVGNVLP